MKKHHKPVYCFRLHTGQWDADGELCLFFVGGPLISDGPAHAWLTTPSGEKLLRAERKNIEPADARELDATLAQEVARTRAAQKRR